MPFSPKLKSADGQTPFKCLDFKRESINHTFSYYDLIVTLIQICHLVGKPSFCEFADYHMLLELLLHLFDCWLREFLSLIHQ